MLKHIVSGMFAFVLGVSSLFAADNFFAEAVNPEEAKLPAEGIYPNGRKMLFSGYSPHDRDYERYVKAGFNTLGPVYLRGFDEFAAKCKAAGVRCIYCVHPYLGEPAQPVNQKMLGDKDFDFEKAKAGIAAIVQKAAADTNIAAWSIAPEELRYWYANEYKYLELAYQTIKENDPLHRPVFMYIPNHYGAEAVAKLIKFGDFAAKGSYNNYSGNQDARIWMKWSVEQELAAIAANGNSKVVPLLLPEMYQPPKDPADIAKIPAWVRHDVYLGLVTGAKGILVYSLWPRAGLPFEEYASGYCKAAAELNGEAGLARIFLFGQPRQELAMTIDSGVKELTCKLAGSEKTYTAPSVNFAFLAYGKERWLFAVNSAQEPVTVTWTGFPEKVNAVSAFPGEPASGTKPENGKLTVTLAPLEVAGFCFSAPEPEAESCD